MFQKLEELIAATEQGLRVTKAERQHEVAKTSQRIADLEAALGRVEEEARRQQQAAVDEEASGKALRERASKALRQEARNAEAKREAAAAAERALQVPRHLTGDASQPASSHLLARLPTS